MADMRIGLGFDVHRLVEGRKLFLGGVEIPSQKGALGHSDGDALLHAICDAILGAAALGDIGEHFPDTDPKLEEVESTKLLASVKELAAKAGFQVVNVDSTVILDKPKLSPYKQAMRQRIASVLGLAEDRVSVRAKTANQVGLFGTGEAVGAQAVVLLRRS